MENDVFITATPQIPQKIFPPMRISLSCSMSASQLRTQHVRRPVFFALLGVIHKSPRVLAYLRIPLLYRLSCDTAYVLKFQKIFNWRENH